MGKGSTGARGPLVPRVRVPKSERWHDQLVERVDLALLVRTPADRLEVGIRRDWFPSRSRKVISRARNFAKLSAEKQAEHLPEKLLLEMDPWDQPLRLSLYLRLADLAPLAYTLEGEAMADERALVRTSICAIDWHMTDPKLPAAQRAAHVYTPTSLRDLRDALQRGLRFVGETAEHFYDDAVVCELASGERVELYFDEIRFDPAALTPLCFVPGVQGASARLDQKGKPVIEPRAHPAVATRDPQGRIFDEWSYALRAAEALQRKLTHPADTVCRGECATCSLMCMQSFTKHLPCDRWGNDSEISRTKATISDLSTQLARSSAALAAPAVAPTARAALEASRTKAGRELAEARGALKGLQPCSQGNEGFDCPCTALFGAVQREIKAVYRGSDKPPLVPISLYAETGAAVPEYTPALHRDAASGRDIPYD